MNWFPRELRDLSFRSRFVLVRKIRDQNVAEHSFYVAVYAGLIADKIKWDGNKGQLLQYALWHDTDEVVTGDIPGPVKRSIIDVDKYDQFVMGACQEIYGNNYIYQVAPDAQMRAIVKVANLLDECFYLVGEAQLGNHGLHDFINHSVERLRQSYSLLDWLHMADRLALSDEIDRCLFKTSSYFVRGVSSDVAPK